MSIGQALQSKEMYKLICERDLALMEVERRASGVTICIPTHDEPKEILDRAVYSALNQTVKAVEVIVVDDGSDVPVVRDDVRVVRITNRGLPSARNTALMLTTTFGFLPLDADDWLHPSYIEKTLPLLAEADVVLAGLQEWGEYPRNQAYNPGFDKPWEQVTVNDLWVMNRFFYCALMRTQTLRDVGGYNPLMAGPWGNDGGFEDHDLWIDLMSRGTRFAAVNEPLLNYNTSNPGSMLSRAERNREALHAEMRRHHNVV